ncbi:U4/U6 X U5 tri-snRNP complex subunit Snu23 [Schizosaccharomyces japonicus yFS275]|uniref:U4/U6 X U5 tri-snRNP complex subunit Snu23 n=1 Tax=Schizosaccharomyces japonicus (strain yFS275 / FY16936) TaxID=402676 RepID=B6JX61_SCHJY|nr:U4/U6 X U5 tri-snRNP complex subunit Snu23 [Schizosaccharomyces japonicus yFS275]EEB05962.1 U4/U6 X U5 tri-snRNP complex subunit Snu23 [Schizosaccharomyces japonicus yFS275]
MGTEKKLTTHTQASAPSVKRSTRQFKVVGARTERIDFTKDVNKVTIAPPGSSVGRRGKSAGWYCEACDETYRDSLSWLDHLNSAQHLRKTRTVISDERATVDQVRERIEYWKNLLKSPQEGSAEYDLKARVAAYHKQRQKEKELKKLRKKQRSNATHAVDDAGIDPQLASVMGITGFGSTKT